jgi:hypothetical protein
VLGIEAARREAVRSFVADEEKKGPILLDGGTTPALQPGTNESAQSRIRFRRSRLM